MLSDIGSSHYGRKNTTIEFDFKMFGYQMTDPFYVSFDYIQQKVKIAPLPQFRSHLD